MKCPKCHAEVEKGNLYCPKCLAEIPWVQEFNSVETLLEKKKIEEPKAAFSERARMLLKKRQRLKQITGIVFGMLVLLTVVFFVRQATSFEAVYEKADRAFERGEYEKALRYTNAALEKEPENLKANIMLSRIQEKEGNLSSALLVLKPMLKTYPDSVEVYQQMIHLLEMNEQYDEIKALLEDCESAKVREACKEYICPAPVSSLPPGTYTSMQSVSLYAEYENIYYTLDGSKPTKDSLRYTGSIKLTEGTTVLRAIGINDKNMTSDEITRKYVIVVNIPKAPEITPKEGNYHKKTRIEITVPDGCRAYYAFDQIPTVQSTVYEKPIAMPEGYHVFYAILVAANGKVSEVASRIYYLEY